jgi:hypothetical protein
MRKMLEDQSDERTSEKSSSEAVTEDDSKTLLSDVASWAWSKRRSCICKLAMLTQEPFLVKGAAGTMYAAGQDTVSSWKGFFYD